MHLLRNALLVLVTLLLFPGLSSGQTAWEAVDDFPGGPTDGTFSFVVDGVAYVGGGVSNSDLYAFRPETGWQFVGPLPGNKMRAWSFTLVGNGRVIIGGGDTTAGFDVTDEVFSFDPMTSEWTELAPFGGGPRDGCWSFVVGEKGYVGSGFDGTNVVPDFWEYDFATDSWRILPAPPFPAILFASTFVIDDRPFVVGGWSGTEVDFLLEYDPTSGVWTERASFPGTDRQAGTGFAHGGSGYYGGGMSGYSTNFGDFWRYDPAGDSWNAIEEAYPQNHSAWPTSFVLGDRVWIGTGAAFIGGNLSFADTFFSFDLKGGDTSVEEESGRFVRRMDLE